MEIKSTAGEASLRDIWNAADKSTIDVLQDTSALYQGNKSPNKTSAKQDNTHPWPQNMVNSSPFSSCRRENFTNVQGLFQRDVSQIDDDNVSLKSIWTPTNIDNIKNEPKHFYESPLIDLEISENSNQNNTNNNLFNNGTLEDNDRPLIDLETAEYVYPNNENMNTLDKNIHCPLLVQNLEVDENSMTTFTSPKYYAYKNSESPLIDLEISEDSNQRQNNSSSEDYFGNIARRELENNINYYYDTEKSQDELNEETFGKFSNVPNESELTLSDISEATAACRLNEDKFIQKSTKEQGKKPRTFQYSETLKDMIEVEETTTGAKPKTFITKVYRRNNLQQYFHEGKKQNGDHKFPKRTKETNHIMLNSEVIPKVRPTQGRFRKSSNHQERVVTHTRETFRSEMSTNEKESMATRTREIFHTKGSMSYYTTEKITYVRGEKQENASKKDHTNQGNCIVWKNNIGDFDESNEEIGGNYDTKNKKYFQDNSKPFYPDKSKKFSPFKNINYDERTRLKIRNNSYREEFEPSNCQGQRMPPKIENISMASQEKPFKNSWRNETAAKCVWKSSTETQNRFNCKKPDDFSQDKIETKNNNQKSANTQHKVEKHNVTPFRIYDPKLRRNAKKKIIINQHQDHMKFKNNYANNPQAEKTAFSFKACDDVAYNNMQEHQFNKNNMDKADKENKNIVKDNTSDVVSIKQNNGPKILENPDAIVKNDCLKSSLTREGREIAELIVGCERGLDMFKSFYYEWVDLRKQSISLLEQTVAIINESSRKNGTMKQVIAALNLAAAAANFIPHPGAALGAKVAGVVGGFLANIFKRGDTDCKNVISKEFEIKEIFQRDIDSLTYVHMYGMQCVSQFQETCNAIDGFHKQLLIQNYTSIIKNADVIEFMNDIIDYNDTNTEIFYRRLRMCYERLIKKSNMEESRAFVKVFEDSPNAVAVIDLLLWKFDLNGFDNSDVHDAWEELFLVFQEGNQTNIDTIKREIQTCLLFLKKEQRLLSLNVRNLFKET